MHMTELNGQIADSIRVHHASGHFDHGEARDRLVAQTGCDEAKADEILAADIPAGMYDEYKTWPRGGVPRWPCADCRRIAAAVTPRPLKVGDRVKFIGDRRWWTVRAVSEHFAALVRQVEFRPAGTLYYTVLDWRNGVRGPCNLSGQGYGDGSYSEAECARLLAEFEAGDLEVSHRNNVAIKFADEPAAQGSTG